jgi:hypothetical protein
MKFALKSLEESVKKRIKTVNFLMFKTYMKSIKTCKATVETRLGA